MAFIGVNLFQLIRLISVEDQIGRGMSVDW